MASNLALLTGLAATTAIVVVTVQQTSGSVIEALLIIDANDQSKYSSKFGNDFAYYFVSAESERNKNWWEQVAKARWDADKKASRTFSSGFANIDKGYGASEDIKSLNHQCSEAYKKSTKDEIHPSSDTDTTKATLEIDIWKYCSWMGKLPLTLDKSSDPTDKNMVTSASTSIGQIRKLDLISTKDPRNNWFWNIKEREFFGKKKKLGSKDGSGASETSGEFQTLYQQANKTVKEKCEEIYKITDTNDQNKTNNALKFCSLKIAN